MSDTKAAAWQTVFRGLAAILLLVLPESGQAAEPGRPNILFLLGDDLTSAELGCYGGKHARTPAIDRLAADGTLFENSFVTTAICACSRACILAGQHQRTTGIKDFDTPFSAEAFAQTYPLLLKAAGYRIGFMGKWGVAASLAEMKHPASQFDFWRGLPGQAGYWYGDEGFLFKHAGSGKQPFPEALHEADQFPKDVQEFLEGCPADRPWCLSISFKSVHPPRAPHPSLADRFTGDEAPPLPGSCTQAAYATVPEHVRRSYNGRDARRNKSWLEALGEAGLRQGYGHYLRSVETLDLTIARIVAVLEARGVAHNTVIILHGDNGTLNGQKGLVGKWVMYEPSIRVPTIVVDPRQPADRRGGRVRAMALSIDLAPTMLDVAGAKKPEGMQGASLLPLLADAAVPWRKDWFYEHTFAATPDNPIAKSEGVRTDRWKYIRWLDPKPHVEELFDLENDPDELKNLAADPVHRATLEELRARYEHWRQVLPDRKPDPDEYAGKAQATVRPASARPSGRLTCPPIFGDHMVLQRDQPLPVWGTATADLEVSVTFAGQSKKATAAADGRWQVTLDPLPASAEPRDLTITVGAETRVFRDVLVGEVWLCSGQSNMVWQVNRSIGSDAIKQRAADPLLRVAYLRGDPNSPLAATTHPSRWFVATPEVIGDFSAVAATFGSELRRDLDMPVGLVLAATAGSAVETWLSREAVLAHQALKDIVETSDRHWAEFQAAQAKHVEKLQEWRRAHGGRVPTDEEQKAAGIPPRGRLDGPIVAQNFDPAIAPLIPYRIRGAIWYQGESNVANAERYENLLATLITDWRSRWGREARPDDPTAVDAFPFFIVQISNFGRATKAPVESRHAIVREAQQRVADGVANAGLVTAIDGDGDIHPKDKAKIGGRLARLALAKAYGRETEWSGPAYASSRRDGGAIMVSFTHATGGLAALDGKPLAQFGIAGVDRVFHPATATIDGATLRVSSPAVPEPVAVRYAWADNPVDANLVNAAGLPAAPFRTDDWPLTATEGRVGEGPSRSRASSVERTVRFDRDIRPILATHCYHCHGPDPESREADLRLDTEDGARAALELEDGFAKLIARVTNTDPDVVMPPPATKKPLDAAQIDLLRRWIADGAPWGKHWAFEPLAKPAVPAARAGAASPVRGPIDAFVQEKLAARGLEPAAEASRETLIRRVSLDLTGLPPTPEEVDAFVADPAPDAYDKLLDRLLASPAYGERMAWDWLDAARYADSNGYQGDADRTMWPWRDWVVEAFNRNLPYDQFTIWQLAGDLLPEPTFEQKLATGFCRNHMINGEGGRIPEENRVDYVMDMAETAGTVWLGLTLNCCRCHDHKFDPLTQRDYYRMFAFFNQTPVNGGGGNPWTPPVLDTATPDQRRQIDDCEARVNAIETELRKLAEGGADDSASGAADSGSRRIALEAERDGLMKRLDAVRKQAPGVMIMADGPARRRTFVLDRGLYSSPKDEVTAGVPQSLPQPASADGANRLTLATWLVSADNPLTARVTVNRFWQQLFGIGLVKTSEDFGVQGEPPPQQELIDWLAADFRDGGWDVKRLLRQIVTSHTYRQSSRVTPALAEADPENRLLARGPRFRLPSAMIRDQALAVSGLLVRSVGGPPVNSYQPEGVWEEATFGKRSYSQGHGDELYRRSLYTFWRRIIAPTMFFDNASRQTCSVKVLRTNTPLQSLFTFNDVTFVEAARVLAERTLAAAPHDDASRIDAIFRRVVCRRASVAERKILLDALAESRRSFAADADAARKMLAVGEAPRDTGLPEAEHAAWTSLALTVMNLDEALTKE